MREVAEFSVETACLRGKQRESGGKGEESASGGNRDTNQLHIFFWSGKKKISYIQTTSFGSSKFKNLALVLLRPRLLATCYG